MPRKLENCPGTVTFKVGLEDEFLNLICRRGYFRREKQHRQKQREMQMGTFSWKGQWSSDGHGFIGYYI